MSLDKTINSIKSYKKDVTIMEVCGTHTMEIFKNGIRQILPCNIKLISGPGCPVCVTPASYIDNAVKIAKEDALIVTFGDMIKVRGSKESLEDLKIQGANIKIIYSPLDILNIAKQNSNKEVVFLGVGFETTTPVVSLLVKKAKDLGLDNLSILCGFKLIIPALKALCQDKDLKVDGFMLPGHVSAVIGVKGYHFLSLDYNKACAVTGFSKEEILLGIESIIEQIKDNNFKIDNRYKKVVNHSGNQMAYNSMYEIFEPCDSLWRGLGLIKESGLRLKDQYRIFDAFQKFELSEDYQTIDNGCICGEVIKGKKIPGECKNFGTVCTPINPVGPCMVGSEGSCAAYYKYR